MRDSRKRQVFYMKECFRLAARGKGFVSPNPMVGAVLMRGGRVIARGYHRRYGGPHAEVECIRKAGAQSRGTTLYINLEPCAHYGQTPPCVDLIIKNGIRRVVVAMKDPNPLVSGKGIRKLRSAGIIVETGLLKNEAEELNRIFTRHIVRRSPYVHLKIAQSLDGMIAGKPGNRRWLTSPASRDLVHRWRAEYDAVMVGAGTILVDDPRLTTRYAKGRDPAVIIIDGRLNIPLSARVLRSAQHRRVFVCASLAVMNRRRREVQELTRVGVIVLPFFGKHGILTFKSVLGTLYKMKIASVLVEGGSSVFSGLLREGLVDEVSVFNAPIILGSGLQALQPGTKISKLLEPRKVLVTQFGNDVLMNTSMK